MSHTKLIKLLPIAIVMIAVTLLGVQLFHTARAEDGKPLGRRDALFRLNCRPSHQAKDDPIVFPNQPGAAHMHDFYGNTNTNAFSTTTSLTTGGSSCRDQADKAAYWHPSIGERQDDGTIKWLKPDPGLPYYQYGGTDDVPQVIQHPMGIRMIVGDPLNTDLLDTRFIWWQCSGGREPDEEKEPHEGEIPVCREGFHVSAVIKFPDCWDGTWLYPKNPKTYQHVVYSGGDPEGGPECPASHPVKLPEIHFRINWPGLDGTENAFLSSDLGTPMGEANRGRSLHGDFWNAWEEGRLKKLVKVCLNSGNGCNPDDELPEGTSPPPYPQGEEPPRGGPPAALGDANGDGNVNALDLSFLTSHVGQDYPPADFNKDGVVDSADRNILYEAWTW